MIRGTCGRVLSAFFPDNCRVCETPLRDVARYPVCASCVQAVQPIEADYCCAACHTPFVSRHPLDDAGLCALCRNGFQSFDSAYSYGFYEGRLQKLIHLFKYQGIYPLAAPLTAFLMKALPRQQRFDAIVPMPMHWWKRWQRGFNQSLLLAQALSRRTAIPVVPAVSRSRKARPQAGLSDHERRANVRGAFTVAKPESIRGRHLLLIDDVLTTGATASACAAALKKGGAASVTVLTVARTDRRFQVGDHR